MIDASPSSLCIQYNRYRFNDFTPAAVPLEEPNDEPNEDLSEYIDCFDTISEIEGEETFQLRLKLISTTASISQDSNPSCPCSASLSLLKSPFVLLALRD